MLTDTALKHLKPRDKIYKISDRDGMYVVVTPSGSVIFRYDYRLNGTAAWKSARTPNAGWHAGAAFSQYETTTTPT